MVAWIRYSKGGADPKDMRFHPSNPDVVYGCSGHGSVCGFLVSTKKVRMVISRRIPRGVSHLKRRRYTLNKISQDSLLIKPIDVMHVQYCSIGCLTLFKPGVLGLLGPVTEGFWDSTCNSQSIKAIAMKLKGFVALPKMFPLRFRTRNNDVIRRRNEQPPSWIRHLNSSW